MRHATLLQPGRWIAAAVLLGLATASLQAAVLPEDRADALYHRYQGGGVTIDGPALLVRKKFGENVSVTGKYYVDSVSSASIDVVTTASAYTEERKEKSLGVSFLRGKTIYSLGFGNSEENDFSADSAQFSISQDIFGDLTTVTLGYARGSDEVRRNGDDTFVDEAERQNYRLGLSQVITRNMLLGASLETITDEGYLNNPYRTVRYLDPESARGYSYRPEVYPNTRTSNAVALRSRYYMPWRAALHAEYRFFTDTWGIDANSFEVGYTHPLPRGLTLDAKVRVYDQTGADFYADLFERDNAQNFMARDKELSTFSSLTVGAGASWEFMSDGKGFMDKGTLNVRYDHMMFDYDDFRDLTVDDVAPGEEPLYSFTAGVFQLFVSIWF